MDYKGIEFLYNDSLVNRHFEKILDIIGETIKSEKQLKKNKEKILNYLNETYVNITSEKLSNSFNLLYNTIQEVPFKYDTIEEVNDSVHRFCEFVCQVSHLYKDHGYSLLIIGYFWLTRNF